MTKYEQGMKLIWTCCIDTRSYKAVDELCQKNPSIVCEILQHKYVPKEKQEQTPVDSAASEEQKEPESAETSDYMSFKFKCSTCETGFNTANEHREHFRSDWHRFNLKRKNRNLSVINEEEYNSLDDTDRELFLKQDSIAT